MNRSSTRVALVFVPNRINVWLRFGRHDRHTIIDRQRRVVEFGVDSIFCRIRWEANAYGTVRWQLAVMQAAAPNQSMQRIAGIVPGARLLLRADRDRDVQLMLRLIDNIEAQSIHPADVAVAYWRTAHNRLAGLVDVPLYTRDRHAAYRLRRQVA